MLIDFDGTLVYPDILAVICGIVGKEKESEQINKEFFAGKKSGITALIERINFLQGVSLSQIQRKLDENEFLINGAKELVQFLNEKHIISILNSGNIMPVLHYYQQLLGITYVVGTQPRMNGNIIVGITEEDFPGRDFKLLGIKRILEKLSIQPRETLAIGDSPADKTIFEFAGRSIAINPKEGTEKYADYVIKNDLSQAITYIQDLS